MNRLILRRDPFAPEHTTGKIIFGNVELHSLERPWIPLEPGGKPYESCIPAGRYRLKIHHRPNGTDALVMINPGLAVFYHAKDRRGRVGRFLCLIHPANRVHELSGCVAPGMSAGLIDGEPVVNHSRKAMAKIMEFNSGELFIIDAL